MRRKIREEATPPNDSIIQRAGRKDLASIERGNGWKNRAHKYASAWGIDSGDAANEIPGIAGEALKNEEQPEATKCVTL